MWKLIRRLTLVSGLLAGVAAVATWRRARAAGEVPFDRIRTAMNTQVNPWLVQHGLAGGLRSEIGTIEHMGRRTRVVHTTPVHPTFVDDRIWIPLPYGDASQWAKNVIAAGHCRLRAHDTVYDLDDPHIVPASDNPKLAKAATQVASWLGIKYLRLHRVPKLEEAQAREPVAASLAGPAVERSEEPALVPA